MNKLFQKRLLGLRPFKMGLALFLLFFLGFFSSSYAKAETLKQIIDEYPREFALFEVEPIKQKFSEYILRRYCPEKWDHISLLIRNENPENPLDTLVTSLHHHGLPAEELSPLDVNIWHTLLECNQEDLGLAMNLFVVLNLKIDYLLERETLLSAKYFFLKAHRDGTIDDYTDLSKRQLALFKNLVKKDLQTDYYNPEKLHDRIMPYAIPPYTPVRDVAELIKNRTAEEDAAEARRQEILKANPEVTAEAAPEKEQTATQSKKKCALSGCNHKISKITPWICKDCGERFCSDHRLPEAHHCTKLEQRREVERYHLEQSLPKVDGDPLKERI